MSDVQQKTLDQAHSKTSKIPWTSVRADGYKPIL